MRTTKLRERLASAFHADRKVWDWTMAYLHADIAIGMFKSHATIADLKHEKVVVELAPDDPQGPSGMVLVRCSCRGMSGIWTSPDGIDSAFADHVSHMNIIKVGGEPVRENHAWIAMTRSEKVVRGTELASGGVFSPSDRVAITEVIQEIIDEHDKSSYDQDVDDCPECGARPGEMCIVAKALLSGFPGGVPDCPRDAHL